MTIRSIQDKVAEAITKAVEGLRPGAPKEELRAAVADALRSSPDISSIASIVDDDSDAGFKVKIDVSLHRKPDLSLN